MAGAGRGRRVRQGRSGSGATRGRQAGRLMEPSTDKELKDTLWKAANKLRGSLSASQYKDVILGLVFLKYGHVSERAATGGAFTVPPEHLECLADNVKAEHRSARRRLR